MELDLSQNRNYQQYLNSLQCPEWQESTLVSWIFEQTAADIALFKINMWMSKKHFMKNAGPINSELSEANDSLFGP
jgi:hypothetical protein